MNDVIVIECKNIIPIRMRFFISILLGCVYIYCISIENGVRGDSMIPFSFCLFTY